MRKHNYEQLSSVCSIEFVLILDLFKMYQIPTVSWPIIALVIIIVKSGFASIAATAAAATTNGKIQQTNPRH